MGNSAVIGPNEQRIVFDRNVYEKGRFREVYKGADGDQKYVTKIFKEKKWRNRSDNSTDIHCQRESQKIANAFSEWAKKNGKK